MKNISIVYIIMSLFAGYGIEWRCITYYASVQIKYNGFYLEYI